MVLRLLPPAVLLAIFATQVALVRTTALTPWKGGGFGMFSTLVHGAHRRATVVVHAPDRSEASRSPHPSKTKRAPWRAVRSSLRRLAVAVAGERRHERPVSSVAITSGGVRTRIARSLEPVLWFGYNASR
jgi:hypothetical protein